MQLRSIQEAILNFKSLSQKHGFTPQIFLYDSIDRFKKYREAHSDASFYNQVKEGLKSGDSKRMWKRERYEPKAIFLKLYDEDSEMMEMAVNDLLDHRKDLEGRVDRFIYYCDEILKLYRKNHPVHILSNHQIDHRFISILLALDDFEKYPFYHHGLFIRMAKSLKMKAEVVAMDYPRYQKVMGIIQNMILKDGDWIAHHHQKVSGCYDLRQPPANLAVECMSAYLDIDLLDFDSQ